MTKEARRHPREHATRDPSEKQQTMDDNFISVTSTTHHGTGLKYLTSKFSLCSVHREVNKRGKGRGPDPRFRRGELAAIQERLSAATGRKVNNIDLSLLGSYFETFVSLVNEVLERVYADKGRFAFLGEELASYPRQGYALLKNEDSVRYRSHPEIQKQCFERLYRNALEHAARIIQSNWLRRQLMKTAIEYLCENETDLIRLLKNRYIASDLTKAVRAACESTKNNGTGFYYSLSVLKQLRRRLDHSILEKRGEPLGTRPYQRGRIRRYLKEEQTAKGILTTAKWRLRHWHKKGYPFATPRMYSHTEDFSASTENTPSQGYWYSRDLNREDEILFFLKLPEHMEGETHETSPYKTRTLAFRFLDWLPRAAREDRVRAAEAEAQGKHLRAKKLRFRARKYEDQHEQLTNTIELQHAVYQLNRWKNRKNADPEKLAQLKEKVQRLRESRTCGPPALLLRGHRVILDIPFLPPTQEMVDEVIGEREYTRKAGADRGIRVPIVLSVRNGQGYVDELVSLDELVRKRNLLRHQTKALSSRVALMRNNWERKHDKDYPRPGPLRKKERHLDAIWKKVRRLDREIARQIASRAVWFCERHGVKTLYFENLKNYQPPKGYGDLSWRLSFNLWSQVLETVRYMRQALGHCYGAVWTVSPAWTSRKCHICGETGVRVKCEGSTEEYKGGEYFYCENCAAYFHADVNAARNIIEVDMRKPSVVAGRTS